MSLDLVQSGLLVKLRDSGESHAFTFQWTLLGKRQDVPWEDLIPTEPSPAQFHHIAIHRLKDGDKPAVVSYKLQKKKARAVILIYYSENLPETKLGVGKSEEARKKAEKLNIPVILITHSQGEKILEFVYKAGAQAMVCVEGGAGRETDEPGVIIHQPLSESKLAIIGGKAAAAADNTGFGVWGVFKQNTRKQFPLATRLQALLRQVGAPTEYAVLSKQPTLFQQVFGLFDEFDKCCEEGVPAKFENSLKAACSQLMSAMDKMFEEDFVFHICMSFRLRCQTSYKPANAQINEYYQACLYRMIMLKSNHMQTVFIPFMDRQNHFQIIWGHKPVLAQQKLWLVLDYRRKEFARKGSAIQTADELGIALMLLQLVLAADPGKPSARNTWVQFIKQLQPKSLPWSAVVSTFQQQLSVGKALNLLPAVAFDVYHMVLLVERYNIVDFETLLSTFSSLYPLTPPERTGILIFLCNIRAYLERSLYDPLVLLSHFAPQGTVLSFMSSARDFLVHIVRARDSRSQMQSMLNSIEKKLSLPSSPTGEEPGHGDEEMPTDAKELADAALIEQENQELSYWVHMLIRSRQLLLELNNENFPQYVNAFMTNTVSLLADLGQKEVESLVCDNAHQLPVALFYNILQTLYFLSFKVAETFLQLWRPPQGTKLVDPTMVKLLELIARRWPKLKVHMFEFLRSVAYTYNARSESYLIIQHLLLLAHQLPLLLSVDSSDLVSSDEEDSDSEDGSEQSVKEQPRPLPDSAADDDSDEGLKHLTKFLLDDIIGQFNLVAVLQENIKNFLVHIGQGVNPFRDAILDALVTALTPTTEQLLLKHRTVESSESSDTFMKVITERLVEMASAGLGARSGLVNDSPVSRFFFRIIASCTDRLPMSKVAIGSLPNLKNLSKVYFAYFSECSDTGALPEEAKKFVVWFGDLRAWAIDLCNKVTSGNVTRPELEEYHFAWAGLTGCCGMLKLGDSILGKEYINARLDQFSKISDEVDCLLMRTSSEGAAQERIPIKQLLLNNGVTIPPNVEDLLAKSVIFTRKAPPEQRGRHRRSLVGVLTTAHPLRASESSGEDNATGKDNRLSPKVQLRPDLSFDDAQKLFEHLEVWLSTIMDNIEMLVHFSARGSVLFDAYLERERQEILNKKPVGGQSLSHSFNLSLAPADLLRPHQSETGGLTMQEFNTALWRTKKLLVRLLRNESTLQDIFIIRQDRFRSVNVEDEFAALMEYSEFQSIPSQMQHMTSVPSSERGSLTPAEEVRQNIRATLELLQFSSVIQLVVSVCEQYQLSGCLEDEDFHGLQQLADQLGDAEFLETMTAGRGADIKQKLDSLLCHASLQHLQLFAGIQISEEYCKFIREHKFNGPTGAEHFIAQYQLVTNQLVDEEYNETVLNHLHSSLNYALLFLKPGITFKELMRGVAKIPKEKVEHAVQQLQTVTANITLVRFWFSRAQGETLENVVRELEYIVESGTYLMLFGNPTKECLLADTRLSSGQVDSLLPTSSSYGASFSMVYNIGDVQVLPLPPTHQPLILPTNSAGSEALKLVDLAHQLQTSEERITGSVRVSQEHHTTTSTRLLGMDELDDLVRRLGFVEATEDSKHFERIQTFLLQSKIVQEQFQLRHQLACLAHPEHIDSVRSVVVDTDLNEMKAELMDLRKTLSSWEETVATLHRDYPHLLFFSVQQIVQLARMCHHFDWNPLLQTVGCLFENGEESMEFVRRQITQVFKLPHLREFFAHGPMESRPDTVHLSPMYFVGNLLSALVQAVQDKKDLCIVPGKPAAKVSSVDTSALLGHVVHSSQSLSPCQLLHLLLSIYDGFPESFQVLRCLPSTTEEQLELFLQRSARFPQAAFVLLEVNNLPNVLQERVLTFQLESHSVSHATRNESPQLHCIETGRSVLQDAPWVDFRRVKDSGPDLSEERAKMLCQLNKKDIAWVELVYGRAGDGKSHYIHSLLSQCPSSSLTIAINESFTASAAVRKLQDLHVSYGNTIYFNITLISQPKAREEDCVAYSRLMSELNWFMMSLFGFCCVQDPKTGDIYRLPGGKEWRIYVEVPACSVNNDPETDLQLFCEQVPILKYIGRRKLVRPDCLFTIDNDTRLVCKYLLAYKEERIDRLYTSNNPVRFSQDEITDEQCQDVLKHYMPRHIRCRKIMQRLFVRYMLRRCAVLEQMPGFNYNLGVGEYAGDRVRTNTEKLGSTLMETMLREVKRFCDPAVKASWAEGAHEQLIYDTQSGGSSFRFISLQPQRLEGETWRKFSALGVDIPNFVTLKARHKLDALLACALNIPLERDRLAAIDEANYVLTLDYAVKMLNINERRLCAVPVIIEGETGVGKTALLRMLCLLWNSTVQRYRNHVLQGLASVLGERSMSAVSGTDGSVHSLTPNQLDVSLTFAHNVAAKKQLSREDVFSACSMRYDDILDFLLRQLISPKSCLLDFDYSLALNAFYQRTAETTANLLKALIDSQTHETFYKLNVHAALTPESIQAYFQPIIALARQLQDAVKDRKTDRKRLFPDIIVEEHFPVPLLTVFLDEVNTSSCIGLFKELLVDKTLDGETLPENIFLVAACNPHRSSSVAVRSDTSREDWVLGSYYVRPLPPSLHFLVWDYGALDESQEREYIEQKIAMMEGTGVSAAVQQLGGLISWSQKLMRQFAKEQLEIVGFDVDDASTRATSCVSQRDIQRVFILAEFFEDSKKHRTKSASTPLATVRQPLIRPQITKSLSRRSILLALALVYYLRLDRTFRQRFIRELKGRDHGHSGESFLGIFQEEMTFLINQMDLPVGIAKTEALKENLFAIVVCSALRLPLIIVGAPGSSKTLSFNLATNNLKGAESRMEFFRNSSRFPALDPHYYQCSRRSTSLEIENVFKRAIKRQESHNKNGLPINCVVFMDEAGLPEDSHESLKVLHYYLDDSKVAFVAITNRILDAAKTNRAISLFRPTAGEEDLKTLARGCMCQNPDNPPAHLHTTMPQVAKFCNAYSKVIQDPRFGSFFGLRDFIHFVHYLRRHRSADQDLTPQLVMCALERNFNGVQTHDFAKLASIFLSQMKASLDNVQERSVVEILKDSLADQPLSENGEEDGAAQVRYKLIIDESEDDSMCRLLFLHGVLDPAQTRTFMCSDFPGDDQLQEVNLISAVKHAALEGRTVVMSETDAINESFYDLFNQHFRCIDDGEQGRRYYANVAIGSHSKPCRVDPRFQCVVHMRSAEVLQAPLPFLNRFEKFRLSQADLLNMVIGSLQPSMRKVVTLARSKVEEFVSCIGEQHFVSLTKHTIESLFLDLLPLPGHKLYRRPEPSNAAEDSIGVLGPGETVDENPSSDGCQMDTDEVLRCCLAVFEDVLHTEAGFRFFAVDKAEQAYIFDNLLWQSAKLLPEGESKRRDVLQKPEELKDWLLEALDLLNTVDPADGQPLFPDEEEGLYPTVVSSGARFTVTLIIQWIVIRVLRRLLQLLRPEPLVTNLNVLPEWCPVIYLCHQHHFNLKELLTSVKRLNENGESQASKLVCFARTTPHIHRLIPFWPSESTAIATVGSGDVLRQLVFEELDELALCKLDHVHTQDHFSSLLRQFSESATQRIFVVVANSKECSRRRINHVRMLMEEQERLLSAARSLSEQSKAVAQKLFVLLLHSPPAMFHGNSSYPALFLHGWDHHYIDAIGSMSNEDLVEINQWMKVACLPNKTPTLHSEIAVNIQQAVRCMLPATIPTVVSRVHFGECVDGYFNRAMDARSRADKLVDLLEGHYALGEIITEKFCRYWSAGLVRNHVHQTAQALLGSDVSLSMYDKLHNTAVSLIHNFVTLVVHKMNEHYNLEVLLSCRDDEDSQSAVAELFRDLLRALPEPTLNELKLLKHTFDGRVARHLQRHPPVFPFFHRVWRCFDQHLEVVLSQLHTDASLDDGAEGGGGQSSNLEERAISKLEERLNELKAEEQSDHAPIIVVQAMAKHHRLWTLYFTDFIQQRLHLAPSQQKQDFGGKWVVGDVERELVSTWLNGLNQVEPVERRPALLHILSTLHLRGISRLVSSLRPLAAIHSFSISPETTIAMPTATGHDLVESQLFTHLVMSLHASLSAISEQCQSSASSQNITMISWCKAFTDSLVMLPALRFSPLLHPILRGRVDVMATIAALLSALPPSTNVLQSAANLFSVLSKRLTNHSEGQLRLAIAVKGSREAIMSALEHEPTEVSVKQSNLAWQHVVEKLLEHFFPTILDDCISTAYRKDDVLWLLKALNCQTTESTGAVPNLSANQTLCSDELPSGIRMVCMAQYWLQQLLTHAPQTDRYHLTEFSAEVRFAVGEEIAACPLDDCAESSTPSFIPAFYYQPYIFDRQRQLSSMVNRRLQQPLAFLYFHCCLDRLRSLLKSTELPHVIVLIQEQEQYIEAAATLGEKCVLQLEKQALIQVFLYQFASFIAENATTTSETYRELFRPELITEIDSLILDERSGGGVGGGHSHVVLSLLCKQLHSSRRFVHLLNDRKQTVLANFDRWLEPFCAEVKKSSDLHTHMPPFTLQQAAKSPLGSLYQKTRRLVRLVATKASQYEAEEEQKAVTKLVDLLKEVVAPQGEEEQGVSVQDVRMVLWLCTYQFLYVAKKTSAKYVDAIERDLDFLDLQPCQIRLLSAFADPSRMMRKREQLNPTNPDAVRLTLNRLGEVERRRHRGEQKVDALWQLFNPRHTDQDDVDLRHAVANMVAAVMGANAESNHLWTMMFNPAALEGTFIVGNMYPNKVSSTGLLYDCGCELTAEGDYGRSDYAAHGQRGTLTLHSLYLLLWSNFAAFCVGLLTQPDAYDALKGRVISEWQSIHHYCVSQLRTMWLLLRSNLNLNDEERAFFVMKSMYRFREVAGCPTGPLSQAIFNSEDDVDTYEVAWHWEIFQSTLDICHNPKVMDEAIWQSHPLLMSLRDFSLCYPAPVTITQFTQAVEQAQGLSTVGGRNKPPSSAAHLDLLHLALLWRRRLHVGGILLADLVELYSWLHSSLAYLVTAEQAARLKIGQVMDRLMSRYSRPQAEYVRRLFHRVTQHYNAFVDFCGGMIGHGGCAEARRENQVLKIGNDTPLLAFLSDTAEEGQGNDVLFVLLQELNATQNRFLESAAAAQETRLVHGDEFEDWRLKMCLSSEESEVFPIEIGIHSCLLGDITPAELEKSMRQDIAELPNDDQDGDFMRIVRRRHLYTPWASNTSGGLNMAASLTASLLMPQTERHISTVLDPSKVFDLPAAQRDILSVFVAGRPRIVDLLSLRTVFQFKQSKNSFGGQAAMLAEDLSFDEASLRQRLPHNFQKGLPEDRQQLLSATFHDQTYEHNVAVIKALLTVLGHVCQTLIGAEGEDKTVQSEVSAFSLREFLARTYSADMNNSLALLEPIGLAKFPQQHAAVLFSLSVLELLPALLLFHHRLQLGLYDFAHLPLRMKAALPDSARQLLQQLPQIYHSRGQTDRFEQDLRTLEQTLTFSERQLVNAPEISLQHFLVENKFYESDELPVAAFPFSLLAESLVELRLLCRRLINDSINQSSAATSKVVISPWSPLVTNVWKELPGFLKAGALENFSQVFTMFRHTAAGQFPLQSKRAGTADGDWLLDALTSEEEGEEDEEDRQSVRSLSSNSTIAGEDPEASFAILSADEEDMLNDHLLPGFVVPENVSEQPNDSVEGHHDDEDDQDDETSSQSSFETLGEDELGSAEVTASTQQTLKKTPSMASVKSSGEQPVPSMSQSSVAPTTMSQSMISQLAAERVLLDLSVDDVCDWLREVKMERYVDLFVENEIDGSNLPDIDDEFLEQIGITNKVHRVQLLGKLRKFKLKMLAPSMSAAQTP